MSANAKGAAGAGMMIADATVGFGAGTASSGKDFRLLDTHYHFDFLPEAVRKDFLGEIARRGIRVVAQTLTPSGFGELLGKEASDAASGVTPRPLLSLGFHPWFIGTEHDAERELALFAAYVGQTRFIGEIGLDFTPRRVAEVSEERQVRVLREVLECVREAAGSEAGASGAAGSESAGGESAESESAGREPSGRETTYVLSIHAVRAAGRVLDLIEEVGIEPPRVVPVFHRFSGTSQELTRLVRMGGYISVSEQMLATKRGRAYVRQVPAERMLLESDLPTRNWNDREDCGVVSASGAVSEGSAVPDYATVPGGDAVPEGGAVLGGSTVPGGSAESFAQELEDSLTAALAGIGAVRAGVTDRPPSTAAARGVASSSTFARSTDALR